MLDHRQANAGTELALLIIENYKKTEAPVSKETIDPLLEIAKHYTSADGQSRRTFIKTAVSWSSTPANNKQGAPELHDFFSQIYTKEKDFALAEKHFLRGTNPRGYAEMLVELSRNGYESEKDLFIARAVFQYLCLSNLKDANAVFTSFLSLVPLESPLINFVKFLLKTAERDAAPLFKLLNEKYAPSLARDESFHRYMEMIGKIYFGIEPRSAGGMGGLLSSLMKGMFDSDNE